MGMNKKIGYLILMMICLPLLNSCDVVSTESTELAEWQNFGEIVFADDPFLPDERREQYLKDAEKLAVRYIYKNDSTQTEIPQGLIDLLYNGLIHIAISGNIKASEVTDEYKIHARMPYRPREILVFADSTAPWMDSWRNKITETGNPELDELLEQFNFSVTEFRELAHVLPTTMTTLRSDRPINGRAVGRLFEKLDFIESAGPNGVTDGSDLRVTFFEDYLKYTFEYGFGDCMAGCINRHFWHFYVYPNGNVLFAGEKGAALPDG